MNVLEKPNNLKSSPNATIITFFKVIVNLFKRQYVLHHSICYNLFFCSSSNPSSLLLSHGTSFVSQGMLIEWV